MKKISVLALIAITIVACKKETKTVIKTDPKTGKTISIEVPTENSTEKPQPDNYAINEKNGVYIQSFKLEKGKTYPLITIQKDTQSVTAPNGQTQSGNSETIDDMSFTVNDLQNGIYDISINLIGKKSTKSVNGQTISVDTKATAPKDEQLKMMWTVNKALVGNKLQMKMKENGDVVSITGFDAVYNKISSAVARLIKETSAKTEFIKNFKDGFNEKSLKEQFTKNLKLIPKKGVKIGEKWTEAENATPDGNIKLTTTYMLKNVENGKVYITVNGGIPYKSEKNSQQGMTHSMSSELNQTGNIILDQTSGWIKNQNINVKTKQTETISDGKQTQSMKSVSNSTVIVNP